MEQVCLKNVLIFRIVELGEGVTDIQKDCFANSGLASINIPDTVTNIDNGAFYECSKLKQRSR